MPQLKSHAAVGQDAAGADVLAMVVDLLTPSAQVLDVGALGQEAAVKDVEQVGGLVHAGNSRVELVALVQKC